MKILITLCARGGSKGIKNKNIFINGLPLIYYSIKHAQTFLKKFDGVLTLSTDSLLIKDTAAKYGLTTDYLRPDELANDTAGKLEAIKDILTYEEQKNITRFDCFGLRYFFAPLRDKVDDLVDAFEQINSNTEALNLFSVSTAHKNPYFNMVELQD